MSVTRITSPDLEILDELISNLEMLITASDETPIIITSKDRPKRATYRPIGNIANTVDRKPKPADAVYLNSEILIIRLVKTQLVKLMSVEVTVLVGKNGRGETSVIITGKVDNVKKIRGGYEIDITISETRRVQVTPGQKLRESVERADVAGWNRWCQDIKDFLDLAGITLADADLTGYDLCCADLSGADLTGADLTGAVLAGANLTETKLDNVKVVGTDFFRARMKRTSATLISLSGMPEKESVIFSEN